VLIVHQVPDGTNLSDDTITIQKRLRADPNLDYLETKTRGLTRSRNIALRNCNSKYMIITDDDVWFVDDAFQNLSRFLAAYPDAVCHTFESLKQQGNRRAVYPKNGASLSDRQILRVASFEMVVDCEHLQKLGVMMREDMGVGSKSPISMGEETVFLADIRRVDGKLVHHKKVLVVHPDISTGEIVNFRNIFSKGVILRRSFRGATRLKFFIKDAIKALKDRDCKLGSLNKRLHCIRTLFSGCYMSNL